MNNIKGLDKAMGRMKKAKNMLDNKKMWTERGIIAQKKKEVDKPDMVFTSKPTKF